MPSEMEDVLHINLLLGQLFYLDQTFTCQHFPVNLYQYAQSYMWLQGQIMFLFMIYVVQFSKTRNCSQ